MNENVKFSRGFTFIEILVVIGIISTLFGISILSLLNIRVLSQNNTSSVVIVSDLKKQQIKAMTGDTEGRGTPNNYGVKILPDKYVLFHGSSYNPSESTNTNIPIENGYQLVSTFQNDTLNFASKSGELISFNPLQNTITLSNTNSGQSRTIILNKYGTVTDIN